MEAEVAYQEAIAINRSIAAKHDDVPAYQKNLARYYYDLGHLFRTAGRAKEAEAAYMEAIAIFKPQAEKHPEVVENQADLAHCYSNLANVYGDTGRVKEEETTCKKALAIDKLLAETHPEVPDYQVGLGISYRNLGSVFAETGRAKEGEVAYKEAITIFTPQVERHPEVPEYQVNLGISYRNLGLLYRHKGQLKEAESAYTEALVIYRNVVKMLPEAPKVHDDLAMCLNSLGILYHNKGQIKESEAAYAEALSIYKNLVERHPDVPEYQRSLASFYNYLIRTYCATGRAKEGEATAQSALFIFQSMEKRHPNILEYRERLALIYYDLACSHARALAENNGHAGRDADEATTSAKTLTENTFGCLQQACVLGYFDNPKLFEAMKVDSDLDGVRDRPEYKKLLEKIVARTKPDTAPVDKSKAQGHQAEWAKHLGMPVQITNSIGMKLALIPPGEFEMGSPKELIAEELKAHIGQQWYTDHVPEEGPKHRVRITRPFYFGVFVVTQGEYQRVMGTNPSEFAVTGKEKDKVAGQNTKRFPVEHVSWGEAVEFCRKLSQMPEEKAAGRTYRLPSEAEWEYACRAENAGRWFFSAQPSPFPGDFDQLGDFGWLCDNSGMTMHAVGGRRPNAWGLYDMYGNVFEWCLDWYGPEYYSKSAVDDPAGPPTGSDRVVRGGAWNRTSWECRSSYRGRFGPLSRSNNVGFRVFLVLPERPTEQAKTSSTTDAARPSGVATADKTSSVI